MSDLKMERIDATCPKCGSASYMYHLPWRKNVGVLNVKCINCNSYFTFNELSNNSTKVAKTALEHIHSAVYQKGFEDGIKSVQPETCEGCKHLGKWDNEVEYGYPSPCTYCKRRAVDHYER